MREDPPIYMENKLVRSPMTRTGRWVGRGVQQREEEILLKEVARDFYFKRRHKALALGKIYEEDNIMNPKEAEVVQENHQKTVEKQTQKKLAQIKNALSLYTPKGEFEIQKKSNDYITQKYKGVNIDLNNDYFDSN